MLLRHSIHIQSSLYTTIGNLKIPYILPAHDDVMKWKRFPYHWPFVRRSHRLLMYPLHKGPIIRTFGISLMLTRPKCWRNTQVAGEMPWCSYDITVMDKSPTLTAIVTKAQNWVIFGSSNGLANVRRQTINQTNILSVGSRGTHCSEV